MDKQGNFYIVLTRAELLKMIDNIDAGGTSEIRLKVNVKNIEIVNR